MAKEKVKHIKCLTCGNVVSINSEDVQHKLNDLLAIIQFKTKVKVMSFSVLHLLDNTVSCCDKPEYWEV